MKNIMKIEETAYIFRNRRTFESFVMMVIVVIMLISPFVLLGISKFYELPNGLRIADENIFKQKSPVPVLYSYAEPVFFLVSMGIYLLGTSREILYYSLIQKGNSDLYVCSRKNILRFSVIASGFLMISSAVFSGTMIMESIAFTFYHASFSVWIFLFSSLVNIHHIDSNRTSLFNYQGYGIYQMIITYGLAFAGLLLYFLFSYFFSRMLSSVIIILLSIGVFSIDRILTEILIKEIQKRKYRIFTRLFDESYN